MTAPRFVIGQHMRSVEDFAAAPIGTTVTLPTDRQNYTWVKEADQWRSTSHRGVRSHQRMWEGSNFGYQITELPAETVDDAIRPAEFQFTVGQQVNNHEMIAALPLGTVIGYTRDNLGELFEKLERGWVHVQGGDTAQPIEDRRATADNHEWWTRTNRWFIESLPGNVHRAEVGLQIGTVLTFEQMQALPEGSVIECHNGPHEPRHRVYTREGPDWRRWDRDNIISMRVMGENMRAPEGRVFTLAGLPEVEAATNAAGPLTIEQINALPVGAVIETHNHTTQAPRHRAYTRMYMSGDRDWLSWHSGHISSATLGRRIDEGVVYTLAGLPEGTTLVGTNVFTDNVAQPEYPVLLEGHSPTPEEFAHLAPGSTVRDQSGSGQLVTKYSDGIWRRAPGEPDRTARIVEIVARNGGGIRIAELPTISRQSLIDAPIGSVFRATDLTDLNEPYRSSAIIKRADGWYAEGLRIGTDIGYGRYRWVWWGDGETIEAQRWTVGMTINSAAFDELPVGTRVRHTTGNHHEFARMDNGQMRRASDRSTYRVRDFNDTDLFTIEELPGVTPGPAVGTRMTVEIAGKCQVGTEISRPSGGTEIYRKVETDQWAEVRGNGTYGSYRAQNFHFARYEWLILSVPTPPVPAQVQQELDQMQVRIRQCIDDAVIQQRGVTGNVRDGAWIKLGWDPAPARGTTIHARTAYGLANNSLVEQNGKLFRIDDERAWPERYQTDGTRHSVDFHPEGEVTVIWAETAPLPVYYSANDLLNKFWVIYDKVRARESWCGYVNDCLATSGLNNPGEQPQQFTWVEAQVAELPPVVLAVGQSIDCGRMSESELERHRAAFLALPEGSVARGNQSGRLYVKTQGGWVESRDLSPAFRTGDSVPFVTIEFIAGDDEPADQPF